VPDYYARRPDGPVQVDRVGKPIIFSWEKIRIVLEIAAVEGTVPCEFEGPSWIYRIGYMVFEPVSAFFGPGKNDPPERLALQEFLE
jgi:hypothetical protein